MNWGLDFLGAPKYSDLVLREMPEGFGFRTFTYIFGDGLPVSRQIARQQRAAFIGLNFNWSDDDHNYSPAMLKKSVSEAKRFAPLLNEFPNGKFYVSGATEHKLKRRDAERLRDDILGVLPGNAIYVNNPWEGRGDFIEGPNTVNEVHGAKANRPKIGGRFGFSCDGSDCFDVDITALKQRMAGAEYFFFWCSQFNGRKTVQDGTPRPQRKAWPTSQLIDATIYLHREQGAVRLPKGYIVKPKADQHSVPPEPRALKPIIICPPNVNRIELLSDNGQVVAVSAKPQTFADGRWRYYFDQFGYQISEKAVRIQGHPIVKIRVGKKVVGTANMAFRQGEFR